MGKTFQKKLSFDFAIREGKLEDLFKNAVGKWAEPSMRINKMRGQAEQ